MISYIQEKVNRAWFVLKGYVVDPKAKQSVALFVAQIVGLISSVGAQKLNTTYLSVADFGLLQTAVSTLLLTFSVIEFGQLTGVSRALALTDSANKQLQSQVVAIGIKSVAVLGVLYSLLVYLLARQGAVTAFGLNFGSNLLSSAWFLAWAMTVQYGVQEILKGLQKSYQSALFTALSKLCYPVLILALLTAGLFSASSSLIAFLLPIGGIGLAVLFLQKPEWKKSVVAATNVRTQVKQIGRSLYITNAVSSSALNLDKIILTAVEGAALTGIYAIGWFVSLPITMAAQAIVQTAYRDMATSERLKKKFLWVYSSVIIAISLTLYLVSTSAVLFVSNERYFKIVSFVPIIIAGATLQALYQPFLQFVVAKGAGNYVRRGGFITSAFYITTSLTIIPMYGLAGACWLGVVNMGFGFSFHLLNYLAYRKSNRQTPV